MLTGARAFPGDAITDTLVAVVRADPEWDRVPRDLPPTLNVYLRRCLQKDPKQRIGDMRDVPDPSCSSQTSIASLKK